MYSYLNIYNNSYGDFLTHSNIQKSRANPHDPHWERYVCCNICVCVILSMKSKSLEWILIKSIKM